VSLGALTSLIAACGSSSGTSSNSRSQSVSSQAARVSTATSTNGTISAAGPQTPTTVAGPKRPGPSSATSTKPVGTFTFTGPGTTYSETYTASSILYGKDDREPPAAALSSCSDTSSNAPSEAYIYGTVSISYTQGSQQLSLEPTLGNAVNTIDSQVWASPLNLYAVTLPTGDSESWTCPAISEQNGGGGSSYNVSPGQTITLDYWVILQQAITNATPTITPQQATVLSLQIPVTATDESLTTYSATGQHAANCADGNGGIFLLPYATLPLTSEGCAAANGASEALTG
jgi:hypothetical protein